MSYTVIVSFGDKNEYEFKLTDEEVKALSREDAGRWLNEEFQALECEPRSMVGKILLLDVIVDVAKYSGESRFSTGGEWPQRFALCCAAALKRDVIRVDVQNLVVH
jgi:hypothetical protein